MKDYTLVDRMVLLDCLANISLIGVITLAFPYRVWGSTYLCIPISFFRCFVVALNRCKILNQSILVNIVYLGSIANICGCFEHLGADKNIQCLIECNEAFLAPIPSAAAHRAELCLSRDFSHK